VAFSALAAALSPSPSRASCSTIRAARSCWRGQRGTSSKSCRYSNISGDVGAAGLGGWKLTRSLPPTPVIQGRRLELCS
jgi:hypothetical protein